MNIYEYINEVSVELSKPTGLLRRDIHWIGDKGDSIMPDRFGEKEVKPGQIVTIGIFTDLKCFNLIVSLADNAVPLPQP